VAIVKVSYTRSRKKIKASVRYIQHRPGQDGERLIRSLFGRDGPISRDEVYDLIDKAVKGTTFFRLILSPDPRREDTDRDLNLRELTQQLLLKLSEAIKQDIEWVAALHDDHAPHRHVHVIALIKGKLTREHFRLLRETATELGLFQRRERDLARGVYREIEQGGGNTPTTPSGSATGKVRHLYPYNKQIVVPTGGGVTKPPRRCPVCGLENCLLHDTDLDLELEV
jgi:hypothetical protein